ncbi:MAG: carbohydrate binding family 9 domain-containing protein [Deltaproteobacteria bacterium]|nr:carbohydrate binding family 9 domain-containing protein [Deltaproteobacteria bacterium]
MGIGWAIAAIWLAVPNSGDTFVPRELRATRVDLPPRIDGELAETCWQQAPVADGFVQSYPRSGAKPTYLTDFRVLYDDSALYFAIRCQDPEPEKIVARITRRDRWVESDRVRINLDSKFDRRTAFFFAVNAAGVKVDGTIEDDSWESTDWDGIWQAAVRVTDSGWQAELAIPLRNLRFGTGHDVTMGINVARRISRLDESNSWQFIPPSVGGWVSRFGRLRNLDLPHQPLRLDATPYLAARLTAGQGGVALDQHAADVGVDAKTGLGGDFVLTTTINPDFGQVETDQVVLNLSTTEWYYSEKRPFFLEDGGQFQSGVVPDLFYTRRIGRGARPPATRDGEQVERQPGAVRILGAAKLAGRTGGRLSIGALQAVTGQESALISDAAGRRYSRIAEPATSYSVLRLKQEILGESELGTTVTATGTLDQGSAVTGVLDGLFYLLDRDYTLSTSAVVSGLSAERYAWHDDFTRAGLERDGPLGYGGSIAIEKSGGRYWRGGGNLQYRSPNLALNDLGFLSRPDAVEAGAWVQWMRLEPWGPFNRLYLTGTLWGSYNTAGLDRGRGAYLSGSTNLSGNAGGGLSAGYDFGSCDDRETRSSGAVALCRSYGQPWLSIWLYTDATKPISFSPSASAYPTDRGFAAAIYLTTSLNLTSALQLDVLPSLRWSDGTLAWLTTEETGAGQRFLFGARHAEVWDVTLRSTYNFSTDISLQAYAQFFTAAVDHRAKLGGIPVGDRVDASELVDAPDTPDDFDYKLSNLNASVVLRWEYQPGSIAYLVYTAALEHELGNADFLIGTAVSGLHDSPVQHALMLKLTYLVD